MSHPDRALSRASPSEPITNRGFQQSQFDILASLGEDCIFDPSDDFGVATIDGVGLLITDPESTPAVVDIEELIDAESPPNRPTDD